MTTRKEIETVAFRARRRVLELAREHDGAYLSQACGSAEVLATLFTSVLALDAPEDDRDLFVLSPAHYAAALYAVLAETGRLDEGWLALYQADGSPVEQIAGEESPGMLVPTASLGQGLSQALGMALGRRLRGHRGRVVVLMSDGELDEGQTWEALMVAAFRRAGNLVVLIDANGRQVDGPTTAVLNTEPIPAKLLSFGWRVHEVDGHDPEAIEAALAGAAAPDGAPLAVVCRTEAWHGIPSLRDRPNLHFVRFRPGEAERMEHELATAMEAIA